MIVEKVRIMTKEPKRFGLRVRITVTVLVVQLLMFTVLFLVTNSFITSSAYQTAVNDLQTAAADRSEMIDSYIQSTEDRLTAYLRAGQIYDLLRDTRDSQAAAAAQSYTEKFSGDIDHLEGIYASSWDTTMRTHTNSAVIGKVTRPDKDKCDQLHDALLAADGVYNAGIIISPASGEQIISMYRAVLDDSGSPIGLGGIGIYTSGLVEKIDTLPLNGLDNAQFYLINAATGEYIFHPDSEKITTVADEQYIADMLSSVKSGASSGSLTYNAGGEYVAAYSYLSGRGWLFVLADSSAEVMASARTMTLELIMICLASMAFLTLWVYLIVDHLIKPIKRVEQAAVRLEHIDLSAAEEVADLMPSQDEIGTISTAVVDMSRALQNATADVARILGELADENLAVDVKQNQQYYTGDFSQLADSLEIIKEKLSGVMTNIHAAADQVSAGSGQVAAGALTLSQGAAEQSASVEGLAKSLAEIEKQIQSNADSCVGAHELMDRTSAFVEQVNQKMQTLSEAMNAINETSGKISSIISTIEDIAFQTNILALNAAIEAARAGEAGKGFAVVADEVRNLAAKSSDAVGDTTQLIQSSVEAVNRGAEMTAETAGAMKTLGEYTASVKRIVDEITAACAHQREMAEKINSDITKISEVVQSTSATAEESAAASEELSGQAGILKEMVGKFRI